MATSQEDNQTSRRPGDGEDRPRRKTSKLLPPGMSEEFMPCKDELRLVLVGKTGAGKSASGNTILGRAEFKVGFAAQSVTKQCERSVETDTRVSVIDTPGLFDTGLSEASLMTRLVECIALSSPGPHVFLLVIALGRFTEEELRTVERIQAIFGEEAVRYSMVLFTHRDMLKNQKIEDFIKEAGDGLQGLLKKCGNRYHVFNNGKNDNHEQVFSDHEQVTQLMEKIREMKRENGDGCYTNEMYEQVERAIQKREVELRRRYEKDLQVKEDLEFKLQEMMVALKLKDTDLIEKEEKINDLQKQCDQIKTDRDQVTKKRNTVREDAVTYIQLADQNKQITQKSYSQCKTQ